MARLQLDLPENFHFTAKIPVRIGDINRAWHLSHVNMVAILEEARAQFMVDRGFEDKIRNVERKTGFILGDILVIFKGQGIMGRFWKLISPRWISRIRVLTWYTGLRIQPAVGN
jgi:acyl-CoA thioester hydrolase